MRSVHPSPLDDLTAVLDAVGVVVATVGADQWSEPTPCPQWNVRELVNHLVMGNRLFAGIARGAAVVSADALDPKATDTLGVDPAAAYANAATELVTVFARPGSLETVMTVPFGTVPGLVAVRLRITEALVHGWDLTQATGQQPRFPEDVTVRNLEFARAALTDVPAGRSPFAAPRPVPGDAPALVRLTALLGRAGTAPGRRR